MSQGATTYVQGTDYSVIVVDTDTTVWADLDGQGDLDAEEPSDVVATGTLALSPSSTAAANVGNDTADTTATVTVTNTTDPVPVVLVITDGTANGSFEACANPDDNVASGTTSGGATNTLTVNLYACAGTTGDTFSVAAYHDLNANGQFDSGEPQIGMTQTFTIS